jgi:hypothetical protein
LTCKVGEAEITATKAGGFAMRWLSRPLITAQADDGDVLIRTLPHYDLTRDVIPENGLTVPFAHQTSADDFSPLHDLVARTRHMLEESDNTQSFWREAAQADYAVALMAAEGDDILIDHDRRTLYIPDGGLDVEAIAKSPYFRAGFALHLLRGLRRIDQYLNGAHARGLDPLQTLLFERVASADAAAVMVATLWNLRLAQPGLWRHALGSTLGDIALRFTAHMDSARGTDHDAVLMGAMNDALLQWYRDTKRINMLDHRILEELDHATTRTGTDMLTRARIMLVTGLPDQDDSYLSGVTLATLSTSMCTRLPDPMNEAHLRHICHDSMTTIVNNVAFRDATLASLIFPDDDMNADV